jgi:hypothetical protein
MPGKSGTGREVGTGTAPDLPGIFNRASKSWVLPDAAGATSAVPGPASGSSTGSGVDAVAAIGGGVEASSRRRSSAAEMDGGDLDLSGAGFGFAMSGWLGSCRFVSVRIGSTVPCVGAGRLPREIFAPFGPKRPTHTRPTSSFEGEASTESGPNAKRQDRKIGAEA